MTPPSDMTLKLTPEDKLEKSIRVQQEFADNTIRHAYVLGIKTLMDAGKWDDVYQALDDYAATKNRTPIAPESGDVAERLVKKIYAWHHDLSHKEFPKEVEGLKEIRAIVNSFLASTEAQHESGMTLPMKRLELS